MVAGTAQPLHRGSHGDCPGPRVRQCCHFANTRRDDFRPFDAVRSAGRQRCPWRPTIHFLGSQAIGGSCGCRAERTTSCQSYDWLFADSCWWAEGPRGADCRCTGTWSARHKNVWLGRNSWWVCLGRKAPGWDRDWRISKSHCCCRTDACRRVPRRS